MTGKKVLAMVIAAGILFCCFGALFTDAPSYAAVENGWEKSESGEWYYYQDGAMQTGWVKSGGKWYYLAASGAMQTGWVKIGDKWYYLAASGAMQTGWVKSGDKWYYLAASGAMQTGWVKSGDKWYYLAASGAMQTGWVKSGGKWYYLAASGAMQTGWLKSGGNWYYLKSSGVMVTGRQTIAGKEYYFNASGILQEDQDTSGAVVYDGITLTEDIALYMHNMHDSVTSSGMSAAEQLWAMFVYIADRSVYPYMMNRIPYYAGIDWPVVYAHDMMFLGGSTCHGNAALFGYAAKLCGYENVYWCSNQAHAWVEVDGLLYDPVFMNSSKHTTVYGWTYAEGAANAWLGAGYYNPAGYAGTYQYIKVPNL